MKASEVRITLVVAAGQGIKISLKDKTTIWAHTQNVDRLDDEGPFAVYSYHEGEDGDGTKIEEGPRTISPEDIESIEIIPPGYKRTLLS